MKRIPNLIVVSWIALALAACSQQALSPSSGDSARAADALTPSLLRPAADPAAAVAPLAANANGFSSPLFDLATAPNGDLLVADAGAGVVAFGGTSGVLDIPLPGVTSVGPIGRGTAWATRGAMGDPETDSGQALFRVTAGKARLVANLYAFEAANDPDGAGVDSNPFDVQSLGGHAALVVDAGGNTLLRVSNQGAIAVLATFPDELVPTQNLKDLVGCPTDEGPLAFACDLPAMVPAQAVPTSVAIGPDGYYYVGELKGFPGPTGASNVWRVAPDAANAVCGVDPGCVEVFDGGFTSIIDLAFDAAGTLHVVELDELSWAAVEIFGTGAGGTINACDLGTLTCSEVATGIPILTAITFGKDGRLWVTENALIPPLANVVQVP